MKKSLMVDEQPDEGGEDGMAKAVDRKRVVAILVEAAEEMVERFAEECERDEPDLLVDMAVWLGARAMERGIAEKDALQRLVPVLLNAEEGAPEESMPIDEESDEDSEDLTPEITDRIREVAVFGQAVETMAERVPDYERDMPDLLIELAVALAARGMERGIERSEVLLRFGFALMMAKEGAPLCLASEDQLN